MGEEKEALGIICKAECKSLREIRITENIKSLNGAVLWE